MFRLSRVISRTVLRRGGKRRTRRKINRWRWVWNSLARRTCARKRGTVGIRNMWNENPKNVLYFFTYWFNETKSRRRLECCNFFPFVFCLFEQNFFYNSYTALLTMDKLLCFLVDLIARLILNWLFILYNTRWLWSYVVFRILRFLMVKLRY